MIPQLVLRCLRWTALAHGLMLGLKSLCYQDTLPEGGGQRLSMKASTHLLDKSVCHNWWSGVLLAAPTCPGMMAATRSLLFRYPSNLAEDDIRVLVLMTIMSMWEAILRVTITIGLILDAHNVFSHLALFLDCFKRYPKLAARISTQAQYKFMLIRPPIVSHGCVMGLQ